MKSLLQRVFALSLCVAPAIYGHCGSFEFGEDYSTHQMMVTKYIGNEAVINIPDMVDVKGKLYEVTSIASDAFTSKQKENIRKVKLGKHIKSIKDCAFSGCSNLSEIVFNDEIQIIEDSAFSSCYWLHTTENTLTFPSSLTYIGRQAFYNCQTIKTLYLPIPTVKLQIDSDAFGGNCHPIAIMCFSKDPDQYKIADDFTQNPKSNTTVFVPVGSLKTYQNNPWYAYENTNWAIFKAIKDTSLAMANAAFFGNKPESSYVNSAETQSVTIPLMPGYAVTKSAAGVTKHIM